MRLMQSQLTDVVVVQGTKASVTIGPGRTVDVDQVVTTEGRTLGEELGELLDRFTLVDPDVPASRTGRRRILLAEPAKDTE
jgi:hypothetical protein